MWCDFGEILAVHHPSCPSLHLQHLMEMENCLFNLNVCLFVFHSNGHLINLLNFNRFAYQLDDYRRVSRVCHDYRSRANTLYPMLLPIRAIYLGNRHPLTTNALLAMENYCMDLVDTVHSQRLAQIRQLHVRRPDFSEYDLLRILMVLFHLYILLKIWQIIDENEKNQQIHTQRRPITSLSFGDANDDGTHNSMNTQLELTTIDKYLCVLSKAFSIDYNQDYQNKCYCNRTHSRRLRIM